MLGYTRGAVINGSIVVWLVTSHCLRRALLVDQGAVLARSGGSFGWGGLDGRCALDGVRVEAHIDRSD